MSAVGKIVCIPEVGTRVRVAEDWTFALYNESRNSGVIEAFLNKPYSWEKYGEPLDLVTLMEGTELVCQRVYIRAGLQDFSSITWTIKSSPDSRFYEHRTIGKRNPQQVRKLKKGLRFWVKLADVNAGKLSIIIDTAADETQESDENVGT